MLAASMGCTASCSGEGGRKEEEVFDTRRLLSELIQVHTTLVLHEPGSAQPPTQSHLYPRLGARMGVSFLQPVQGEDRSRSPTPVPSGAVAPTTDRASVGAIAREPS